ncbi:DUF4012 domain-containing protein [Patescibacteria group bacterium]|nr:DUF4012 domain-containing protein [Patescibacteria group bacterium]
MSNFDKIEFNKKALDMSTKKRKNNRKKLSTKLIVSIIVIIIAIGLAVGFPAYATYNSGLKTYREARILLDAVKKQDIELASQELIKTKKYLQETQKSMQYLLPLKYIPLLNWYYNDADHLMTAGGHSLDSVGIVIEAIKPYADVLGLKGQGSFTTGSAEDRIRTAILTASKITPKIDELAQSLSLVEKEIEQVNPDHYPSFLFGNKIHSQLVTVKNVSKDGVAFVNEARPLIKILPMLLGESEEKKYLILFQNDKELRPTGGFITAYAILRIDKGVIHVDKSEDIYSLDDSIPNKPPAPAPILKYLAKVYTFNLRDSNLSPDFIESMKTFNSLYDKAGEKVKVDGIIAMDTNVLVTTIKILDDQVSVTGLTFNTKNDPRCDCPQVIYELEDNISRPVNYVKIKRKGLLGELLQALMTKALSSSPKIYWGPLFQALIAQTNEKHILFYLFDKDAQSGIEALNAAGRIKSFDGDYLHINQTSFSGAKVNIFLEEEVENNYDINDDGAITKTVVIHYKNPHPPSDCNLERGGLCLNAEYRDWFRIYVPKGSKLVESKGSQVKITTYEELGKTVFDGFLTVRPQGIATLTLTYTLPFKLISNSPLPVLIQKQPGTGGNKYTVNVNGKAADSFELFTDKNLTLQKP